jgi:HPt (histidine-containing phosphotransfer) domain-containing protein
MREKTPLTNPASPKQEDSAAQPKSAWDKLTARYLDDLPRQLDGLFEILELKDYGTIKAQAHRIKGTSGTYRLETISKGAAQLESAAQGRNHQSITRAIENVRKLVEMESTRISLKSLAAGGDPERISNG